MTGRWLLLFVYLLNIFDQINSRDSPIQCWKCEVLIRSTEDMGILLNGTTFIHNQLFDLFNTNFQFQIVKLSLISPNIHWWIVMENVGNPSI